VIIPAETESWTSVLEGLERDGRAGYADYSLPSSFVFRAAYFLHNISQFGYAPGIPEAFHMLQVEASIEFRGHGPKFEIESSYPCFYTL
jgi:hypothetical protein